MVLFYRVLLPFFSMRGFDSLCPRDMNTLLIDIETYSSVDIGACGNYKYTESDDFDVLLFSYSIDGARAVIVDLASGETIPDEIRHACYDPSVEKIAHNMVFEITCLSKYFGQPMIVEQWHDTMIMGAYLGLPLSLKQVGEVLNLEEQKLKSGVSLISLFCKPYRGKRVFPEDKPDKWDDFKAYCLRDVDTEVSLYNKVKGKVPVPSWERELQIADYNINRRGVRIDIKLAENAIDFWTRCEEHLIEEAKELTGLENPNSVTQLKDWLAKWGVKLDSVNKQSVEDALKHYNPEKVKRVLEIRKELCKTSVKKYQSMLNCACSDERAHGITQYYGTATGRFAGRLIQTQNLPQNHIEDLDFARDILASGDYDSMEMNYESVTDTLSQLIRTALIPSDGRIFHICDFSAIECRVIAWLAGENWVLDVFRNGGDIYCATASKMFGVPVEKHGVNGELRQKGKIATLALGYQGGVDAMKAMGADRMGLPDNELKDIVKFWRKSNPKIVSLWQTVDDAAKRTITTGQPTTIHRGITMSMKFGFMFITLPSGRSISYPRARIGKEESWDGCRDIVTYERLNQTTRKWERTKTYGGKLTENIVQAIARDILAVIILRCEKAGLPIVFHVHDEVIIDSPRNRKLEEVEKLFCTPIPWCPGLPLKGAGYSSEFYKKD